MTFFARSINIFFFHPSIGYFAMTDLTQDFSTDLYLLPSQLLSSYVSCTLCTRQYLEMGEKCQT